jgi:hypothetical protein
MVEERGRGGSSKGGGGGEGGDAQTEAAEAEAPMCQIVVEVGVLRMAEKAGAHDWNGKMRDT